MSPVNWIECVAGIATEIWIIIIKSRREEIIAAIIPVAKIINGRPATAIGYFSAQVRIIL